MRAFLILVVFGLAACGGDDDNGNLGGNSTLREVCTAFADVLCDKVEECEPPAPANCTADFVTACCSGSNCDQTIGNAAQLEDCLDAFRDLSCAELENEDISLASCE